MENDITLHKVHYLNKSMRFLMIGCGLIVWIIPLMPFLAHATNLGDIRDFIIPLGVVFIASVACLIYAFGCRLITTAEGIIDYGYYPFHSFKSWKDLERIDIGGFGIVFLVFAPKAGRKTNRTISISTYIDDWNESELVTEIRKYAPSLIIPEEFQSRKDVPFIYRSGTLLLYFLVSMFFVLILNGLLPDSIAGQYSEFIGNLGLGGVLAALGGMEGLLWFGEWRDAQQDFLAVKKMTLLFYATPISGIVMAYIIYLFFQLFTFLPNDFMNFAILFGCILQLRILLRFFGRYGSSQ